MRIKPIKCPSCGAPLDIKRGADTCECLSCGCMFSIDNGKLEYTYNKNIYIRKDTSHTERYIEDAEVIRAMAEEKEQKGILIFVAFMFLLMFGFTALCFVSADISSKNEEKKIEDAKNSGMICAGYYEDYLEKDYKGVVAQFEAAGFTNIQIIDLHEAGVFFWNNGEVESVSVDGDTHFSRSDYFSPDAKVVISYR